MSTWKSLYHQQVSPHEVSRSGCIGTSTLAACRATLLPPAHRSARAALITDGTAGSRRLQDLRQHKWHESDRRKSLRCSCSSPGHSTGPASTLPAAVALNLYGSRNLLGKQLLQLVASGQPSGPEACLELVQQVRALMCQHRDVGVLRTAMQRVQDQANKARATAAATAAAPPSTSPNSQQQLATPASPAAAAWQPWSWGEVARVVVVGLGSLYVYEERLASGAQTAAQSTRASCRLYQTALASLLLGCTPASQASRGADSAVAFAALDVAGGSILPGMLPALQSHMQPATQDQATGSTDSPAPISPACVYDPELLPADLAVLRMLGFHAAAAAVPLPLPSASDSAGAPSATAASGMETLPAECLVAHVPTLFYMPQCPREVYEAVVAANAAAGTLGNVALLGNSLRGQADMAMLLGALAGPKVRPGATAASSSGAGAVPGMGSMRPMPMPSSAYRVGGGVSSGGAGSEEVFVGLVKRGCVSEVLAPDFAAHGVAMGLHLFMPPPAFSYRQR